MNRLIFVFCIPSVESAVIICAVMAFALFLFVKWSSRDPERCIPTDDSLILSAADGRVCSIDRIQEATYIGGEGVRIGVYLSLFDVHINRVPISGIVRFFSYVPGVFLPAFQNNASIRNEHQIIGIENDRCKILVRQIAGIIARRIVCRLNLGDTVQAGERFGKITFGSRVEVLVPSHIDIRVRIGDRVKAGETILGVLR